MKKVFEHSENLINHYINMHNFYIEQAKKRLLCQFKNIEEDAKGASEKYLKEAIQKFNPDVDDECCISENALNEEVCFYAMLDDMLNNTRLNVISSMFFEFDKNLRSLLKDPIRYGENYKKHGDAVKEKIDEVKFLDIMQLFKMKNNAIYDKYRCIVNVYKHGEGDSFDDVVVKYPELIKYRSIGMERIIKVDENHIDEFSNAIMDFWTNFPNCIDINSFPNWFKKVFKENEIATAPIGASQ